MLFLDRIEVLGFKSFCDKTVLKIPTGITGIVGPNGCGKSNVVDAMNWVLGEQSAKSLRSDKMEEVIFNGSKNRKPLNMAQVILVWKTEWFNPAAPEITIARRLFRSGESQYEMNGEVCRLKDIHTFFLNESFDPLAYSILEQGKIEQLFLSKPMERRALIEEVAGVAEFKHKKRSAQMKLAENQIQMERIQDILNEVEKQLSSLKRQAARTRRYQILTEEKQVLQRILFERRFQQIQAEQQRLMALLADCSNAEQQCTQVLQRQELVVSELKLRLAEVESGLYQQQGELHQMEMQIQESQNLLQFKRQRIEEWRRNIEEKTVENQRFAETEAQVQESYAHRSAEEAELRGHLEDLVRQHTELFAALEQKASEMGSLEQRAEDLRKQIIEQLSSASQLKNEQTRLHTQQDHLFETIQRKENELGTGREHRRQLSEQITGKESVLSRIDEEMGYLDQTKSGILQSCDELKLEWDRYQLEVQAAFKKQSELQHALQKLDAQQHSSKFYNESARSLLHTSSHRAMGMMMDFIQTDPHYETAVENFLADKLNYLIVQSEDSALASIDYLKQEGLGYCSFVIKNGHDPNPPVLPEELRREEGVIGSLRDVVTIQEEALPAVAPFMESAVMVSNLQCAQVLIKKYPEYQFITVQGDVILSPALYAGGAKADDVPGLIAIQRERKNLAVHLETVQEQLRVLEEQVRSIQNHLDISNHELVRLNEVRESKNKDRLLVQLELDQIQKEFGREEKLIEILSQEMVHLANERESVEARSDQFAVQLQEQTAKREESERLFGECEQHLNAAKAQHFELQGQVQESRVQIAERKERHRSLLAEIARLHAHLESIRNSIAENANLIAQRHQEISDTETVCGKMEAEQVEMLRLRDQRKLVIAENEKQKEDLTRRISAQETEVQSARSELDRVREERMNVEIESTRTSTQREDLLARANEEMGLDLESLQPVESEWTQLQDEELKNQLQETESKIDRLGSINMLALEEYTQMEERHRFLKTQYEDLRVSIETLLDTIQRIDVTSLKRFQEAFAGVQGHFQDLFQRLFDGGRGEMVLSDPEDPNESGIEVHVQPPGKRLQNMNLMSGGEKTLTGIAFLMSLFQYHASPFCVMDEVDAALDEINVQRFTALISDMRKQIQFIVVTHNKRTMEAADQLYGVTMAEPGVSSILSAKFEEAEALLDV